MPSYKQDNFKESNVNYLNKDFTQLKQSLLDYAKGYFPNSYKDFNETSPGMMLIEMSAYVGDVLSFYIDQQYKEMLLPLAEERKNIINLAKMFGYNVKPIVPAYVDLTFTSEVVATATDASTVDYTDGGVWDAGIKVSSEFDTNIVFETLGPIDFTISSSNDTNVIAQTNDIGLVTSYTLSRTVKAVSAETATKSFTISSPTKFLRLTIPDTNVVDIISCVDSNGNNWYEVDYLAQDKVPIKTHYSNDDRINAYYSYDDNDTSTDERRELAVPYSLEYIETSKRFVRETNEDNTTSLVFGNGILKNGTTISGDLLDLEQIGIVVPGQPNDLNSSINPLLGNEYSTLGETPIQTTLTVTYRKGGGIKSNVGAGSLNTFSQPSPSVNNSSANATIESVTNKFPAVGGKNAEDADEIREKTKAFFSTQNRCVTKEDYEARVMNMSSEFGNIAKVYVSREQTGAATNITTTLDNTVASLVTQMNNVDVDSISATQIQDINELIGQIPSGDVLLSSGVGEIRIYILSYNVNKSLFGNPAAGQTNTNDDIPVILKNNLSRYIDNFRILTDSVEILDGFIINFGVFFDVVAHKYANKQEVKVLCIEKIKEYFKIEKMQFSQAIYVSQLEYELMNIDGVAAVNYVTITQDVDWRDPLYGTESNGVPYDAATLGQDTFKYYLGSGTTGDFVFDGISDVTVSSDGTEGYGWKYSFQDAYENGIILPPSPEAPGVFELKNPNQNIKGRVR